MQAQRASKRTEKEQKHTGLVKVENGQGEMVTLVVCMVAMAVTAIVLVVAWDSSPSIGNEQRAQEEEAAGHGRL
jgi:hypothetical protein